MKIWKKVLLAISGIAMILGISCVIIGFALGVNFQEVKNVFNDGHYNIGVFGWDWDDWTPWHSSGTADNQSDASDKDHNFTGIENLDIDVKHSKLILKVYEGSDIKVSAKNVISSKYTARSDGNTLRIKDNTYFKTKSPEITLSIPKGMKFNEISLDVDGGEVVIDTLNSNEFSAEIGGGRLYVSESLTAMEIDCSVGAGVIEVEKLSGSDVDLDCGAGQVDVTLDGSQKDYRLEGDCGIGQIIFGSDSWASLGKKFTTGTGTNQISAECGVGQIDIQFSE
ncbi:MAG TPA: DUF4097 family beta strand repeat protein [Candidatus Pelethocola excrementipullorum]|nr:DUF4097 family beta strand repeat protein [Candidatus Pelethocola excrementipullorum]